MFASEVLVCNLLMRAFKKRVGVTGCKEFMTNLTENSFFLCTVVQVVFEVKKVNSFVHLQTMHEYNDKTSVSSTFSATLRHVSKPLTPIPNKKYI